MVVGDFYFGEDFGDVACGIDEEGGAFDAHVFFAVHGFFCPDVVGEGGGVVGVGEEGEGEVEFGLEFEVGGDGVGGDAEDDGAGFLEVGEGVAEVAGFGGAAWGVVFGVEVEDDFFASEGGEGDFFVVGGVEEEVGGGVGNFERHGVS